jgi:hypothetical protein
VPDRPKHRRIFLKGRGLLRLEPQNYEREQGRRSQHGNLEGRGHRIEAGRGGCRCCKRHSDGKQHCRPTPQLIIGSAQSPLDGSSTLPRART